jgi:glycosyltransferase involved in cell wall biosynthesis
MSDYPFISCLCPTFRKPAQLQNAVACFLEQQYPIDKRELLILEDTDMLYHNHRFLSEKGVYEVKSHQNRFETLSDKYNELVRMSQGDILVVWEDDDVYLPNHLSRISMTMGKDIASPRAVHPSRVYSTYGNVFQQESATGRFHAALAFNRKAHDLIGGWPKTKRADFDQQLIAILRDNVGFDNSTPEGFNPTYCFRWESSGAFHGQNFMKSGEDEDWYKAALLNTTCPQLLPEERLVFPKMDADTKEIYRKAGFTT